MGLNLGYVKTLVAILKLVSILLLIIAYAVGMSAYFGSEYNKGCIDPDGSDPQRTTVGSIVTFSSTSSPRPSSSSSSVSSTTEEFIVSFGPQPSTSQSPEDPEEKTGCDKVPILWMERFHLIVSGVFILLSAIMLILHLVKKDLLENPKFTGIDFGYHFFGAIWLIVAALFMTYSATKIDSLAEELCHDPDNCQLMKQKLTAAAFAFLAAVVFLAIGVRSHGKKFYQTV